MRSCRGEEVPYTKNRKITNAVKKFPSVRRNSAKTMATVTNTPQGSHQGQGQWCVIGGGDGVGSESITDGEGGANGMGGMSITWWSSIPSMTPGD